MAASDVKIFPLIRTISGVCALARKENRKRQRLRKID
jgi:hypothetical protein